MDRGASPRLGFTLGNKDRLHDALLFGLSVLENARHDSLFADEVGKSVPDLVHRNACSVFLRENRQTPEENDCP
jgi:hypothetical protein